MADAHKYLVPEYYSGFSCKGGACRSTCCSGWGISFSMNEYFRLLGMDCSDGLRRKLDGSFHLADDPTEDRYAQITTNWRGDCPLHMENGLCQLHFECGEGALASVCRLYPRGVHTKFERECSCANSCEAVLEALFQQEEPMRFMEKELAFGLAEAPPEKKDSAAVRYYARVRKMAVDALQNREYELGRRIALLGGMTALLSEAFRNREEWVISGALEVCGRMTPPEMEKDDRLMMRCMYRMLRMFSENVSVEECIRTCLNRLGLPGEREPREEELSEAAGRYRAAAETFERQFPDWQRLFEQMLVNHVFFEGYPFSDRRESLWEAHMALCAAYAFVRVLAVMMLEQHADRQALVDVCAAAFRLIEHSSFDWNVVSLLESDGIKSPGDIARLALA